MTNSTRAIAALRQIMLDDTGAMPIRRRIDAAEQLLDYEAPTEIVEEAKAVLTTIFEDAELFVDIRLEALKLMRRAEARKIVPARATVRDDSNRVEQCRMLETLLRKASLIRKGVWPLPKGWDADLSGPDYVPMPTNEEEPAGDIGEVLRNARLRNAHNPVRLPPAPVPAPPAPAPATDEPEVIDHPKPVTRPRSFMGPLPAYREGD